MPTNDFGGCIQTGLRDALDYPDQIVTVSGFGIRIHHEPLEMAVIVHPSIASAGLLAIVVTMALSARNHLRSEIKEVKFDTSWRT